MTKYRAKKVKTEDGTFDSQAEYRRWCELKLLERAGEITGLTRQLKYHLDVNGIPVTTYVADFVYWPKTKPIVVEDVKGYRTREYKLKRKLMRAVHGIEIQEVAA